MCALTVDRCQLSASTNRSPARCYTEGFLLRRALHLKVPHTTRHAALRPVDEGRKRGTTIMNNCVSKLLSFIILRLQFCHVFTVHEGKAPYTLPVSTPPYARPVNTGVIVDVDTRVHGPWTRTVDTAREHGLWTRVVCTELKQTV